MTDFLRDFHPLIPALFGTGFIWGLTALGAATIFIGKSLNHKVLDWMLGFAAGVLIAALSSPRKPSCPML